jgi:predicted lipoprotein with Yx(FWY)xxD motif
MLSLISQENSIMRQMWLAIACIGLATISATLPAIANERSASNEPAHMQWTDDGPILVTPAGATLYTNGADALARGKSACSNVPKKTYSDEQGGLGPAPLIGANIQKSCAEKWPPFLADESAQPTGDFALVDRTEGGKQWTYRGFPLYTSVKDKKPGDRFGEGGGFFGGFGRGFRFATVPQLFPAALKFARRDEGLALITVNGKAVYTPVAPQLKNVCANCNANAFKPLLAPALARAEGDWSIVDAGPGLRQFAFRGKPLYAAPEGLKESEIAELGGWEVVVLRSAPPIPAPVRRRAALIGDVFTDKTGMTLYTYGCTTPAGDGVRCDDAGDPAGYMVALCGDAKECARRWRPYQAAANAQSVGDWSVIDIAYPMFTTNPGVLYPSDAPHVKAWAYRGNPVYTYYEDKEPGDAWGDGVKWIGGSSFSALRLPGRSLLD